MNIHKKPLIFPLLMLALLVATPLANAALPFDIEGPSAENVDTIEPTVVNFQVSESGIISDLNVRIHLYDDESGWTYWDNMYIEISHLGVDAVLMDLQTDIYGSGDTLIATFSDGGDDLASSAVNGGLTEGTFAPLESLSVFNGLPLEGQWTLTMYENSCCPGDGTDLVSSSIFGVKNADVAVPALSVPGLLVLILSMFATGWFLQRSRA